MLECQSEYPLKLDELVVFLKQDNIIQHFSRINWNKDSHEKNCLIDFDSCLQKEHKLSLLYPILNSFELV